MTSMHIGTRSTRITIGPATLYCGDCADILADLPSMSIDSAVVDPPYGIALMGAKWDHDVPSKMIWSRVGAALKPGAHLLSFFSGRTYHRGAVEIEDSGFDIRDQIFWTYGTGFPKSHNLTGEHAGWGTALKPAHEPIVMARKPFKGTVATNVIAHGTGALNIEACRIGDDVITTIGAAKTDTNTFGNYVGITPTEHVGRWPANFIHDGSDDVVDGLGEAARFFYCAKASKADREEGNVHPTVKPTDLMRYLCRLVTPKGGTVLDPFMGSGSTGKAALAEGFRFVGIERDPRYFDIAVKRLRNAVFCPDA